MSMVYLKCIKEGSRLRVRITSNGYLQRANCQFPRALRMENRTFSVDPANVTLSRGTSGSFFYRVRKPITIIEDPPVTVERVYDLDPDCVICLEEPKTMIMVPCGHYCLCTECSTKLKTSTCPICRSHVNTMITPEQIA